MSQASLAKYRTERQFGRPVISQHPFPRALEAAGVTLAEWARGHDVSRSKAKSWFLEGKGGRPIPRKLAEAIRKECAVPLSAWKHGIKD